MADKFKVYAENANPVNLMTDDEFASDSQVDQGAKPREVIYSAKINTALRECSLAMKGLLNVLSTASKGEIGPNSTIAAVQDYLNTAFGEKVNTLNAASATKLQNARTISLTGDATGSVSFDGTTDVTITADVASTANVDSLTNNDSEDNANVNFSIGNKNFTKTVNNVAHATNADNATNATNATTASKLGTDAGSTNTPVYFSGGIPVAITGIDKSTKIIYQESPQGFQTNPKLTDIFYFNTLENDFAPIAQRAAKLTLQDSRPVGGTSIITYGDANVGSVTQPVYFVGGIPKTCTTKSCDVMTYKENTGVRLSGLTMNSVNAGVRVTIGSGLSFGSVYVVQLFAGATGVFGILVVTAQNGLSGYFFGYNATANTEAVVTAKLLGNETSIVALEPTN